MLRRTIVAAVLLGALVPFATTAQETPPGMIRAVPGQPTRVFIMAAFGEDCKSLPAPAIEITQTPKRGAVQFRQGQSTTVQYSLSGKCSGVRVIGTGIYYAAREDAAGEDTFTISARSAAGQVSTRTFKMFVTEGL